VARDNSTYILNKYLNIFNLERNKLSGNIFPEVWYRFNEKPFNEMWAYYDYGTLEVLQNSIRFTGKKGIVNVFDIHNISYGRQGIDFMNNWVKIIYGEDKVAYFADGTYNGWGGALGGTKRLLKAIQTIQK